MSRGEPRVHCSIDVNSDVSSLHNRLEPLTRSLSDLFMGCAASESDDDDDRSDITNTSQQSPRRRDARVEPTITRILPKSRHSHQKMSLPP